MSKIDVHHHFYAPVFTEALQRAGGDPSGWNVPSWTLEADKILNKTLAQLARQVNEYAAEIRDAEPTSYGFFASLPSLLNTDLALLELAHSLDTLHADGVILFTRYGTDNHYLGHPDFLSIWAELNRREAVVFIHPTHAVDTNLVNSHLPQPMFDYPHETSRTAIDLVLSDTLRAVAPDCKIILSHAGGTLPYLIYRPAGMVPYTPFSVNKSTEEIAEQARTFYFDTAISANPLTLGLPFKFAKKNHVQFGSDFPNAPTAGIEGFTKQLDEFDLTEEQRRGVEWEAAAELSPSLRQN